MYTLRISLAWFILPCATAILLYANNSVFQITAGLSVPVLELPKTRSLFFDWGFQMNYNMPSQLSSFYNAPIWPGLLQRRSRQKRHFGKIYVLENFGLRQRDYTVLELYRGLESSLESHGFHASCLLRSVCELASQPFVAAQKDFLTEMITFALSPSMSMALLGDGSAHASAYKLAELHGSSGGDCGQVYCECSSSVLDAITGI